MLLLIASVLLPLIPTGKWWIRLWDFPKVQFLGIGLITLILLGMSAQNQQWDNLLTVNAIAVLLCCLWLLRRILPFTFIWPKEVQTAKTSEEPRIKTAIINLMYDNQSHEQAVEKLQHVDDDLLLLIEIDQPWHDQLNELKNQYKYHIQAIRSNGLGLALWSKHQIIDHHIEHLVFKDRASIFADIKLTNGQVIRYAGLHPTPPGLQDKKQDSRFDSWIRDAELIKIANRIQEDPTAHWLVAGDFNDVAWSHTTRLFKRISGLKDPRIGRRLLHSYHAQYWLMRYPLDHVFVSPSYKLHDLKRELTPGSDHFAIHVTLTLNDKVANEPTVSKMDKVESKERVKQGMKSARQREKQ